MPRSRSRSSARAGKANRPGRAPTPATAAARRRVAGTLLKQKAATLFEHFAAALHGDEEGLHQLRVWGRRLRTSLRLLAGKPKGERARRAERILADLTRTAGTARDLDVLVETFDARLRQGPARTAEQRRLRRRLVARQRRGRATTRGKLLDLPVARLRAELADLVSRACDDLPVIARRFRGLCERHGRSLLTGFAELGAHLDVGKLHALRRRARRLRYAVEIYLQIFGGDGAATKPWKTLQDRIGTLHDHHVLAAWFGALVRAEAQRGAPALVAAAEAEVARARDAMHRLHLELLAADPASLVRSGLAAVGVAGPAPPT
jgi:CHAD domain-containing protein